MITLNNAAFAKAGSAFVNTKYLRSTQSPAVKSVCAIVFVFISSVIAVFNPIADQFSWDTNSVFCRTVKPAFFTVTLIVDIQGAIYHPVTYF